MNYEDNIRNIKVRLIGVPLVSFTMAVVGHFTYDLYRAWSFFFCWAIAAFFTLIIWQSCIFILLRARKVFPEFHQTQHRLIFQGLAILIFVTLFTFVSHYLLQRFLPYQIPGLFPSFIQNIVPTTIILLLYESVYFFYSWRSYIVKTENLIHENVKSQLDALKSQLDPHFLFNSLNTLASLVGEQNVAAQTFLEQLSDVYRYVLINREKNMVTMKEEMMFLDAYIYLNKIRFRENLQIEKRISTPTMMKSIAPLSLQLLMENALKHNAATKDHPLKIVISETDDGYIVVENNIQEKKILEKSTRLGLQNIVNRYKLLSSKEVFISSDANQFVVKIPLLSA
jgi:sensor histidine kinase YesM